jgi:hypothetical protein
MSEDDHNRGAREFPGFLIGAFIAGGALTLLHCAESLDRQ